MKVASLRRALWRDPRAVLWAYAFVVALTVVATALLPGYPNYGEDQGMLGFALIVDGAVLVGLLRGSKVAWGFAVFGSVMAAGFGMLGAYDLSSAPKFLLVGVLGLVALVLLLSPAMDARVWNRLHATGR